MHQHSVGPYHGYPTQGQSGDEVVTQIFCKCRVGCRFLTAHADLQKLPGNGLPALNGSVIQLNAWINAKAHQGKLVAQNFITQTYPFALTNHILRYWPSQFQLFVLFLLASKDSFIKPVGWFDFEFLELLPDRRYQACHSHSTMHRNRCGPSAGHNEMAHQLGELDHFFGMRTTLLIIALEQSGRGVASENPG